MLPMVPSFHNAPRNCQRRVVPLCLILTLCLVHHTATASKSFLFAKQQQSSSPWTRLFSRKRRRPASSQTDSSSSREIYTPGVDSDENQVSDNTSDDSTVSKNDVAFASSLGLPLAEATTPSSSSIATTMEDEDRNDWWKPALSALTAVRLSRWTATGLQLGLICYIAHAVYKAASEVLDEYNSSMTSSSTSDPLWMRRDQVTELMQFLNQLLGTTTSTTSTGIAAGLSESVYLGKTVPQRIHLQVAEKLLSSGLPLCSSTASGTSTPSVESVLNSLTRSEAALLQQCLWVPPSSRRPRGINSHDEKQSELEDLTDMWKDICGLHTAKQDLLQAVARVRASGRRRLQSGLFQQQDNSEEDPYAALFENAATGILLYGPPGCGKTMLVKALSATAHIPCLVVTPSALLRKYVGETNQQVRSLFGLAQKLSPAILCLDELDGLFRERSQQEHEVSRDLKTEFLQWWDGMLTKHTSGGTSNNNNRILVVGATNRPFDVDSAVLRRLPQSHYVGLPNLAARTQFLQRLLQKVPTAPDFQVHAIAVATSGYTPSDLAQVLQTAAWNGPLREQLLSTGKPRALLTTDVLRAIHKVPPTPVTAQYQQALDQFSNSNNHRSVHDNQDWYGGTRSEQSLVYDDDDESSKWETGAGNFYNIGTIQIDRDSFERIRDLWEQEQFQDDDDDDSLDDDEL